MRYRSLTRSEYGDEPVSLLDAKAHLRVDSSSEDTLIGSLITAARRWSEDYCDRTFLLSQYVMKLDSFYGAIGSPVQFGLKADGNNIEGRQGTVPNLDIELPRPRYSTIDDLGNPSSVVVTYLPSAGASAVTLSSSEYRIDGDATPAVIRPLYGKTWPSHLVDQNSVTVSWWAGQSTNQEQLKTISAAINMLVAHLWRNREMAAEAALTEVPMGTKALLDTLRWGSYR